jgi:NAD(P)-dependent dehydrogenase (short-subunit alcohol dehydrogenase family)
VSTNNDKTVALVTGAAQGIGTAIATRLAADGRTVAANDRVASDALSAVCADLGAVEAIADVSDAQQVGDLVARLEAEHGPVDVLVANAAVETMGGFLDQTEEEFWRQIDVNLTGTFHLIQAVLPGMRRLGRGRIIITSSIWAITGFPRAAAYAASKAGLIQLTKNLAFELGPEGIIVSAIAPGVIDSPQIEVDAEDMNMTLDELRAFYSAKTAVERVGQPEEIAGLISFLASDTSGAYLGQVLQPNGGAQFGWA